MRRLISFVGTGKYEEVPYDWPGKGCFTTAYVAACVAHHLKADEVLLLATPEAQAAQKEKLEKALSELEAPPKFRWVGISKGEGAEAWALFNTLMEALNGPEHVILDITHGFRAQPFFAAAALSLWLQTRTSDHMPNLQVLYGEHMRGEAGQASSGKIWLLNSFVELLVWGQGLGLFLATGRNNPALSIRLQEDVALAAREAQAMGEKPLPLASLKNKLATFCDDFNGLRVAALLGSVGGVPSGRKGSAQALLDELEAQTPGLVNALPPLAQVVKQLKDWLRPLHAKALNDASGLQAQHALAEAYFKRDRLLECMAVLREAWVSAHANDEAVCVGASHQKAARSQAEKNWYWTWKGQAQGTSGIRNDLLHAGLNPNPAGGGQLRKVVEKELNAFQQAMAQHQDWPLLPGSDGPVQGLFLNLSNHPHDAWEEAQMKAALALGERVQDHAFPTVDPAATTEEIEKQAKEVVDALPKDIAHALVMGEHTMVPILVSLMQKNGITCYATTSKRQSHQDGVHKISRFEFVALRPYPSIRLG